MVFRGHSFSNDKYLFNHKLFTIYDLAFTRKAFMEKQTVEKQTYAIGDRVEKLCAICQEERGHVVASITKRGLISRVTCPKCGTRGSFSDGAKLTKGRSRSEEHTSELQSH